MPFRCPPKSTLIDKSTYLLLIKFSLLFLCIPDWQGIEVDGNLVDAVLLNSSRIGHGYAITKHPEAIKMGKEKSIAIEINPISNQVIFTNTSCKMFCMVNILYM